MKNASTTIRATPSADTALGSAAEPATSGVGMTGSVPGEVKKAASILGDAGGRVPRTD